MIKGGKELGEGEITSGPEDNEGAIGSRKHRADSTSRGPWRVVYQHEFGAIPSRKSQGRFVKILFAASEAAPGV